MTTELHPLGFFLPENTRLLMLGSSKSSLEHGFLLPEYPE